MRFVLVFLLMTLAACVRPVLKSPQDAMRDTSAPELIDDMSLESFIQGLKDNIQALKSSSAMSLTFGKRVIAKSVYVEFLTSLLKQAQATNNTSELISAISNQIDFLEVYGGKSWGEVMITSYFEPIIKGSLKQTPQYSQPLYQAPKDILLLSMDQFNLKFENGGARDLRARLVGNRVLPYYSREEIDGQKTLKKRGLEICWVDPIDAFILQIQGSGVVEFSSGRQLRLSYAEKNGHSYESIGKFLMEKIPFEQLNLQTIEAHLRTLPKEELQTLLNKNPSYVFFKPATSHAVTALGVPATAGRTIATDRKYFPKGALGFLVSTKPVFERETQKWEPLSRFVFDQDIGGAIQGGGRVDLFWGRGDEAKKYAGLMKQSGRLYYIVPKAM